MPTMPTRATVETFERSHYASADRDEITREETHPVGTLHYRGRTVTVELEASRYVHSNGWSEWRIFPRRATVDGSPVNISDGMRDAIGESLVPIIEEWLKTDEYRAARGRAIAHTLRRTIIDAAYGLDVARRLLANHAGDLDPRDREYLIALADTRETFNEDSRAPFPSEGERGTS